MVNVNRALGDLDHGNENVVNLKNVSHNIKNIYWKGDDIYGDTEVLDVAEDIAVINIDCNKNSFTAFAAMNKRTKRKSAAPRREEN
jgi:hypothetical protein